MDETKTNRTGDRSVLKIILHSVVWLCKRLALMYVLIYFLLGHVIDYTKVQDKNMLKALNDLKPDLSYFVKYEENQGPFNKAELQRNITYYKKITEFFPQNPTAHGMLGFAYYHADDQNKAIEYFQKATELHPQFFWFYYNLGVINFKDGRYADAIEPLNKALTTNLTHTLTLLSTSEIYRRLFVGLSGLGKTMSTHLGTGTQNCYKLLVLSNLHLKNYKELLNITNYAIYLKIDELDFFYYFAGLAAYELKQYGQAIFYFDKALKENPEYSDTYYYLSLSLKAMNQETAATQMLLKGSAINKAKAPTPYQNTIINPQMF